MTPSDPTLRGLMERLDVLEQRNDDLARENRHLHDQLSNHTMTLLSLPETTNTTAHPVEPPVGATTQPEDALQPFSTRFAGVNRPEAGDRSRQRAALRLTTSLGEQDIRHLHDGDVDQRVPTVTR